MKRRVLINTTPFHTLLKKTQNGVVLIDIVCLLLPLDMQKTGEGIFCSPVFTASSSFFFVQKDADKTPHLPATWWKKRGCTPGRFWGSSTVAAPANSPSSLPIKTEAEKKKRGGDREQKEKKSDRGTRERQNRKENRIEKREKNGRKEKKTKKNRGSHLYTVRKKKEEHRRPPSPPPRAAADDNNCASSRRVSFLPSLLRLLFSFHWHTEREQFTFCSQWIIGGLLCTAH